MLSAVSASLAGILSGGVDVHRCLAAKALGRIQARGGVQPLIDALLDEDEDVRMDAAEALAMIGDPTAADPLLKSLLGDPCTEVKLAAIDGLARLQDRRVVPWLRRFVLSRDEDVIWDEREFLASGWDDWVEIQLKAVNALAEMGASEAVPDITAVLKDENAQDIAEAAFGALARMGAGGVEALAGFLDAPDTRTRRRAAAALASADGSDVQDALPRAFSDLSAQVRIAALRARACANPADIWVTVMLQDEDAVIRAEAVRLGSNLHSDNLLSMLDDPSPCVKAAVLRQLHATWPCFADEGLSKKLGELIHGPSSEVSTAAGRFYARLEPELALDKLAALSKDAALPTATRLGALHALADIGSDAAVATLVGAIDDGDRQIRLEAMVALAQLANADAWPNAAGQALLSALDGAHAPVPEASEPVEPEAETNAVPEPAPEIEEADAPATSTLTSILRDEPAIVPAIGLPEVGIELSSDDMERLAIARRVVGKRKMPRTPEIAVHEDVQRFAARVLGDLDRDEVTLALAAALLSSDAELAAAAADSLGRIAIRTGRIGEATGDAVISAVDDAPIQSKLSLIRVLSACFSGRAVNLLKELVTDEEPFVRAETIRALSRTRPVDFQFNAFLGDPDPSVRLLAAQAIAASKNSQAIEILVDFAFSFEGYHSRQSAGLLRDLDPAQASRAFLEVLGDTEKQRVWSVAIEALEELNERQIPVQGAHPDAKDTETNQEVFA